MVLRYLEKYEQGRYVDLLRSAKGKHGSFGVKMTRMEEHKLIKKIDWGIYSITAFGSKVLKAYDAYMKVMEDK
jgi:hypothetical protein